MTFLNLWEHRVIISLAGLVILIATVPHWNLTYKMKKYEENRKDEK